MFIAIKTLPEKKLIGKRISMSMTDNKTVELWKSFMPFRFRIKNKAGNDLFSIQVFDPSFSFSNFDVHAKFEKWASLEVSHYEEVPEGMEKFILAGGLYAVFLHTGTIAGAEKTFRYVFETWLPGSGYELDNRPHFELLGEKYKNNDPSSEEEVWIPVKNRI